MHKKGNNSNLELLKQRSHLESVRPTAPPLRAEMARMKEAKELPKDNGKWAPMLF